MRHVANNIFCFFYVQYEMFTLKLGLAAGIATGRYLPFTDTRFAASGAPSTVSPSLDLYLVFSRCSEQIKKNIYVFVFCFYTPLPASLVPANFPDTTVCPSANVQSPFSITPSLNDPENRDPSANNASPDLECGLPSTYLCFVCFLKQLSFFFQSYNCSPS
jgi:hypothetical protein